jgi:hypothetical protein
MACANPLLDFETSVLLSTSGGVGSMMPSPGMPKGGSRILFLFPDRFFFSFFSGSIFFGSIFSLASFNFCGLGDGRKKKEGRRRGCGIRRG